MKGQKISSIEGLRGLACFMVIMSHLSLMFLPYLHGENPKQIIGWLDRMLYNSPFGFIYSGTSAVYIFFVLSGYILSYACVSKGDLIRNCVNMATRRYARLAIPVFTSIIICFLVLSYSEDRTYAMPWISNYGKNVDVSFWGAINNGIFSSIFMGDNRYNWVTWTMKIEFYGSLLVFAAIPIINNLKCKALISFVVGSFFVLCSPGKDGYGYASFFFGIALYFARDFRSSLSAIIVFIMGAYLAGYHYRQPSYAMLTSFMTFDLPGGKILHYYFVNMISGVLIVYATVKSNVFSFLVANRFSVWLGKLSFSAYLLQMPVYYFLTTRLYLACQAYEMNYAKSATLSAIITIVAIYFLSHIFWLIVDVGSIKLSKLFLRVVDETVHSTTKIEIIK